MLDVYILDSKLRRIALYDYYTSLIWTERWQAYGDFELIFRSTTEIRQAFKIGSWIAIDESTRIMTVETIEDSIDEEGNATIKFTGRSIEAWLMDRVCYYIVAGSEYTSGGETKERRWKLEKPAAELIRYLFDQICVVGRLSVKDKIPFYATGSTYETTTIPEDTENIAVELEPALLYDTIKEIAIANELGFRLTRGPDDGKVYFNVYTGSDRSTYQTLNPPVVFSPNLNNMTSVQVLSSRQTWKNVAFVQSKKSAFFVYAPGFEPTGTFPWSSEEGAPSGLDRRVLFVDCTNLTEEGDPTLSNMMKQKAYEALAAARRIHAIDGEISQASAYEYEKDYFLGDFVNMETVDGETNRMRVTEQIFSRDENGYAMYPTLTLDVLINPGSWISNTGNVEWSAAEGTWKTIT